ncbi:gag-protease polyprotein [Cucumis melo var. makuwa]|uniref:Gag-protease polyprotein n=1 Tax=Cucumis melo var. makuwa TaxID=1194695 RepID=A0A5A7SU07_CUCMM|nr:gag-protease polyprotein [Cucumis melo var. makuwa]TYK15802.1 gag-protease polyprotein [Cucumis melo var. makuwa]
MPDQLSAEAKHLRDFRKYNPKTFDGSLEDPTKAQMLLIFVETNFRYMRYPNDQEYDAEFNMMSRFAPEMVATKAVSADKFVRGLRGKGQPQQHRQEIAEAGKTFKELPTCHSCERSHERRCLAGSGVCYKCKQPGQIADFYPQKLFRPASNQTSTSQQRRVFFTTRQEAKLADTVVTGMDWLSASNAILDYSNKKVVFNPFSAASFKYKGAGIMVLPKVISAKLISYSTRLNQGTWGILASVKLKF